MAFKFLTAIAGLLIPASAIGQQQQAAAAPAPRPCVDQQHPLQRARQHIGEPQCSNAAVEQVQAVGQQLGSHTTLPLQLLQHFRAKALITEGWAADTGDQDLRAHTGFTLSICVPLVARPQRRRSLSRALGSGGLVGSATVTNETECCAPTKPGDAGEPPGWSFR